MAQLNFNSALLAEPSIPTSAGLGWLSKPLSSLCTRCKGQTLVSTGGFTSNPATGKSGFLITHKCTAPGCEWKEVM